MKLLVTGGTGFLGAHLVPRLVGFAIPAWLAYVAGFFLLVFMLIGLIGTTSLPIAKDINLGLDLQGGFEVL